MADNPKYKKWLNEYNIGEVNEILTKNKYHLPEESDPENDPNSSTEYKRLFVYKLPWRTDKVSCHL